MNKKDTIFVSFILIAMALMFIAGQNYSKPDYASIEYMNNTYKVYGLHSDDYTFIYNSGDINQYSRTLLHESCHEFIDYDYEHFCGELK